MWNLLKKGIQNSLKRNDERLSFVELHSYAFNMVINKYKEKLYNGLREIITGHLKENVCKKVLASIKNNFLQTLTNAWQDY